MTVTIHYLVNQADAADIVSAVEAYFIANPRLTRNPAFEIVVGSITYSGIYNKFQNDQLDYQVLSPGSSTVGTIVDVETGWVNDADGNNFFAVYLLDSVGGSAPVYYDQPGGSVVSPVAPVVPIGSSVVTTQDYTDLDTAYLAITDGAVVDLSDAVASSTDSTPTPPPAETTGVRIEFVGLDEGTKAFFSLGSTVPTAAGVGMILNDQDLLNPGDNSQNKGGDSSQVAAFKVICQTGKTGHLNITYEKRS